MASDQVKVAVRIRPFNPLDIGEHENVLRVVGQTISIQDYGVIKNRDFKYDYVFAPEGQGNRDEDQRKIFHTLGLDLLDNVWDGYNCTIFAYGQTGSGKSYSLMEYGKNKGFVARFVENLFEHIEKEDSVTCKVNLGMLEIYNEKVYDLLSDSKYRSPLKIKERGDGCFEANRLTKINVTEKTQVQKWIMQGYTNRSIAATEMNETSSRAHTIIAIGVWIMDNVHKVEKTSTINIVDLAGSERAKKANTSGKRFTEGNNINKSLLVLGQVIEKLAKRDESDRGYGHIPYRESKLTMLLKNSLGGNSKTVMLATVHPLSNNIEETLSTLRYASRAMVIRNESKVNQTDLRMQVQELLNEIDSLHKQLKGVRSDENADKERLMKEISILTEKLAESEDKSITSTKELEVLENIRKQEEERQKTVPYLLNLNADEMLTRRVRYFISEGNVLQVGGERPTDCPLNEYILLTGIGAKPNYAVLENQKGKVYVKAETGYVFVKGKELEKNLPRRLKHGYTVMFGQLSSMFVFIDQKAACKKNLEDKEASNISYASAKDDFIKFAEKDGTIKGDSLLRNMVVVRDQDIRNANALAIELNKPLTFELILVSDAFAGRKMGKLQIFIKVINKATECEYIWSEDYFLEKYEAMVAFTNKDESVKQCPEDDPFYMPTDAFTQIGFSVISLFHISMTSRIKEKDYPVFNEDGETIGQVRVAIDLCKADGKEARFKKEKLTEKAMIYPKIRIGQATFGKKDIQYEKTWCSFFILNPDEVHNTSECIGNNPDYRYEYRWTIELPSQTYLKFLEEDYITLKFWGIPTPKQTIETYSRGSEYEIRKILEWNEKQIRSLKQEVRSLREEIESKNAVIENLQRKLNSQQ